LLCVNTFRHDFQSENPQIRGLALRSLSGLRFDLINECYKCFRCSSLLEYLVPCITTGLVDPNSYVRAIAVMAVLKIFHFSSETFEGLN
jgi:vesicle coat complex subunit